MALLIGILGALIIIGYIAAGVAVLKAGQFQMN